MPWATPPKYCACIAQGVKLIRITTLSAACAPPAANSAAAAIMAFIIRIETSINGSEHFPAKACPGLDPGCTAVRLRKCDQRKNLAAPGHTLLNLRRIASLAFPGDHSLDP